MRTPVFVTFFLASTATTLAGPTFGVLPASRQGALSLETSASGATQLRAAIVAAYPGAVFRPVNPITPAGLAGCDIIVVMSPNAGQGAITPLTATEQAALRGFVDGGGGALLFTDNDSFAGGASTPANASIANPFGLTTAGTASPWQQGASIVPALPPNPPGSAVVDGPFGVITGYSVGWSGWFPGASAVPGAAVRAQLSQNNQPSLVEFAPGALAAGSGRAVLFSDTTIVFNGYFVETNRRVVLNAIDASFHHCRLADIGTQGGLPGADNTLDNNDFVVFIDYFFDHNPLADRGATGGIPGQDGAWDNNDFVVFIDEFFAGCG
jgi:hypothetical protein